MGKQVNQLPVVWDRKAYSDFEYNLDEIKKDSPANANLVKDRVTDVIKSLPNFPKKFRADELKLDNDGSYRVFNKDGLRVSYHITSTQIQIVGVRHGSQDPQMFR